MRYYDHQIPELTWLLTGKSAVIVTAIVLALLLIATTLDLPRQIEWTALFSGYLLFILAAAVVVLASRSSINRAGPIKWRNFVYLISVFVVITILHAYAALSDLERMAINDWPALLEQLQSTKKFAPLRGFGLVSMLAIAAAIVMMNGRLSVPQLPIIVAAVSYLVLLLSALHAAWLPMQIGNEVALLIIYLPVCLAGLFLLAALNSSSFVRSVVWPARMKEPSDKLDRNNRLFVWALAAATPFVATASSVFLAASMIWSAFYMISRKLQIGGSHAPIPILIASALFYVTMTASTVSNLESVDEALSSLIRVLPFLAVFFVVPRLLRSPRGSLLPYFSHGAALGLWIFALLALYEYFVVATPGPFGLRVSVLSGNPVPAAYAVVAAIVAASLGLDELNGRQFFFRLSAILAGLATVSLTGSISVLVSIPMILVLVFFRYRSALAMAAISDGIVRRKLPILVLATVIACSAVIVSSPVTSRVINYSLAIVGNEGTGEQESLGTRLELWNAGIDAVFKKPLFGYGVQNRFAALDPHLPESLRTDGRLYTHPHNGFLAAAISAGFPGLIAVVLLLLTPIYAAFRSASPFRNDLLLLTGGVATLYTLAGMVGIMFFHDAIDAIFLWSLVLTAACLSDPVSARDSD